MCDFGGGDVVLLSRGKPMEGAEEGGVVEVRVMRAPDERGFRIFYFILFLFLFFLFLFYWIFFI